MFLNNRALYKHMSQQGQYSSLVDLVDFNPSKEKQKVVQLYLHAKPALLCEGNGREYRESMLEALLRKKHITFDFERRSAQYRYNVQKYVPRLTNAQGSYRVVGMGTLFLIPERRIYRGIIKKSKLYDLGPNWEHEQLVAQTFRNMGWKIEYFHRPTGGLVSR
jgi:hypothetical protein